MTGAVGCTEDQRHLAIVGNVERLLADAKVLLKHGSTGTALATAILAFEESGKGQHFSLGTEKPRGKGSPSWHVYRQILAAFTLTASLFQKYGFSAPKLNADMNRYLEERRSGSKILAEILEDPVPEIVRNWLLEQGIPEYEQLSDDDRLLLSIELRWVQKILITAGTGRAEVERQSGLYVDIDEEHVTSDPIATTRLRAAYWISVAERSLGILRDGAFSEPYGELAAYLESLPRPFPTIEELESRFSGFRLDD